MEGGLNLRTVKEPYTRAPGPGAHAEPPPQDGPSTIDTTTR